jgi:Holliday junction resolvasome RuvABC endonuclease subunit
MSKILSFDVSSVSTGWSFLFDGKLKEFGIIAPPKSYRLQEKLYWVKSEVNALLKIYFPDYVLIEETYLRNVKTLKTLMQFIGVINLECFFELAQEPMFISPQTVRSHYKLKTKEDVFSYVQNKYKAKLKNYTFETGNDITDSVLQGLYWYDVLSAEGEKDE